MVAASNPTINFKRLWKMIPKTGGTSSNAFATYTGSTTSTNGDNQTLMWTVLSNRGAVDSSAKTANTFASILNVSSGKGEMAAIIGPIVNADGCTSFEITRDGEGPYLVHVSTSAGSRAGLLSNFGVANTQAYVNNATTFNLNTSKSVFTSSVQAIVPTWEQIKYEGVPVLEYLRSLLIRVAITSDNSSTTNNERYAAVMYRAGLGNEPSP